MEIFYSIQGEGFHAGKAAIFIRLGGCDVGCVWCDVKQSWNENDHPFLTIDEILSEIRDYPSRLVIVTGGEPLMYDMTALTERLQSEGYKTNIETSGAYPFTGFWDWVCFSPKKFKAPHDSVYSRANELKVIVFNSSDFKFGEEYRSKVKQECLLFLQPEWSKANSIQNILIEYVKSHPVWHVSVQTHKYLSVR